MQSPRANRSAHVFERDRGWRGRGVDTEMRDTEMREEMREEMRDPRRFDEASGREAREWAHFDENGSSDPGDRDSLWRRGEYGSRLYGDVVGAPTPGGTAGLRRYRPDGAQRQGPKGYARSDERMRDDLCERLSEETWIDLSEVDVHVEDGRVRLEGEVSDRFSKYAIEDIADGVWGVKDVDNRIRVRVA